MTSKQPLNLAVLEDDGLYRTMLVNFLSAMPNFNVIAESSNTLDLTLKLKQHHAEILILAPFLFGEEANDLHAGFLNEFPSLKIVVLSNCNDFNIITDLFKSGICSYVSKTDEPKELIRAITALSENKSFRSRSFTEAFYLSKINRLKNYSENNVRLNDREIKILNLLWEEKTSKEIAREIFLSVRSVEKIRQDIKEKLNVKSTVGVFKYAIDNKLIGANSKRPVLSPPPGRSSSPLS